MLTLNIWASPLCFVYAPQRRCSLWSHLQRFYHLIHQPPLTSARGSLIPSSVQGRAGKGQDFGGLLLVTRCLPPAPTSQAALQLPLLPGPQLPGHSVRITVGTGSEQL